MAKERGLTYVKLDGDIGILGNGAGLVMSTLDVVAQYGGKPANFLDAGGGSKAEAITSAVEVILANPNVKAVLFNIFGGITRCDEVANGLIEAFNQITPTRARSSSAWTARTTRRAGASSPRRTLPNVHTAATMNEAAEKVVELARHERPGRQRDAPVRVGHHRPRGHVPRDEQPALRHAGRVGRDAGQGRPGRRGRPGVRHLPRRGRRDRREHRDGLRAAALRRRLDPRGGRGRHRRRSSRSPRASPPTTSCASTTTCCRRIPARA